MPIKVGPRSEFFMAICKTEDDVHSFVVAGVRDLSTGVNHVLCAVGKQLEKRETIPQFVFNAIFSNVKSQIKHESIAYDEDDITNISYKAFSITEENYHQFIQKLSQHPHVSRRVKFHKKTPDGYVQETITKSDRVPVSYDTSFSNISIKNTCRKSAINLLDSVVKHGSKTQNIHTSFLKGFPGKAKLGKGQLFGRMFILPVPPRPTDISKENYHVLSRVYQQLENVCKGDINDNDTYKKYLSLKDLYNGINQQKTKDIDDVFHAINIWEANERNTIDTHRGFGRLLRSWGFYPVTSTRKMMMDLRSYKQVVNDQNLKSLYRKSRNRS